MSKLYPYIHFNDGKCREAFNFYKSCLGGTVELMTVGDAPEAMKEMSQVDKNNVMHGVLKKDDFTLIGSDMMRDKAVVGDNVTIMMECDSEKEINDVFSKLSKCGEVFMPLEEMFWGGVFGVLTDKYGVEWSFNFQKKPVKK